MPIRRGLLCFLALLTLLVGSAVSAAPEPQTQADDPLFFDSTRHWVGGEFLAFYQSVPDPERVFGAPITDEFADTLRAGFRIQYFQRARMDYDPNQPAGQRVALAPLGAWLFDERQIQYASGIDQTNGLCRVFSNGIPVCYAFLQFYDSHNGAELFGLPVSVVLEIDGRYIQYFENFRLEFRNEQPAGQRVVVSELGSIDFENRIGNPSLRLPSLRIPQSASRLPQARAFVAAPLVTDGAQQRVDVIVRDQFLEPMPGESIRVEVLAPGQEPRSYVAPAPTDADGLATVRFVIEGVRPNQVIEVQVHVGALDGEPEAVTWFRSWW